MKEHERNACILSSIISYCEQIDTTVRHFGKEYKIFLNNPIYRNAVSLCILQIGEQVGHLSDNFKLLHKEIPWRDIKLMRNIVAHRYGTVDHSITWDVVENDIPALEAFCRNILKKES